MAKRMSTVKAIANKRKKANTAPKLWTEDYVKRVFPKAIQGTGGIVSVIAERLNTTNVTLYKYIKKYPWINDLRQQAREGFVDKAENVLMDKVDEGDLNAVKFTLNHLGRHRGYDASPAVVVNNNTMNAKLEMKEEDAQAFLDFVENKE